MIRTVTWASVCCCLFAATPSGLFAQFPAYGNRYNPYASPGECGVDPRVRRAQRDQAIAAFGPLARPFVETHGDEAVASLFACSKPVAAKLIEFYACGQMGKLPRPRDLLRVIAQPGHGNDVAVWAMLHAGELVDSDSFEAYLLCPLEYALSLKHLAAGAAEARARRQNQAAALPDLAARQWASERLAVLSVGLLSMSGLLFWRRRKQSAIC